MKMRSWNVNGFRSVLDKGFLKWLSDHNSDFVCLQETKAKPEQIPSEVLEELSRKFGYHCIWNVAQKPGYSGVLTLCKNQPRAVDLNLGVLDHEGRFIAAIYDRFVMINAYFPNSQREHTRLPEKLLFCDAFLAKAQSYRKQGLEIFACGDFNIAHKEIDLKNPKTNKDNAGFLPEERAWMDRFVGSGFVDTFRHFEPNGDHYTWWSYRPGVREKNIGWRLDYFFAASAAGGSNVKLKGAEIFPEVKGSDHCPVGLLL